MDKVYFGYINQIKGVAIILVMVGHAIAWNVGDFTFVITECPKVELFWWHFIYAFHMPLFFWVSGFLFPKEKFTIKMLPTFLWKKTYTLVFPFFFAGFLLYAVRGWGGVFWLLVLEGSI